MPNKKCPIWLSEWEHKQLAKLAKLNDRPMNRTVGLLVAAALEVKKRAALRRKA